MSMLRSHKLQISIALLTLFLLIVLILSFFSSQKKSGPKALKDQRPTPFQVSPVLKEKPKVLEVKNIPTLLPQQGKGVDITSQTARESIGNIDKVEQKFPLEKVVKTSTGNEITIYIAKREFQPTPWSLNVDLYGVEFQAPIGSDQYSKAKTDFLESVQEVFNWVRANGADPEHIIFRWGDKEYMNNRAQEWLK